MKYGENVRIVCTGSSLDDSRLVQRRDTSGEWETIYSFAESDDMAYSKSHRAALRLAAQSAPTTDGCSAIVLSF